MSKSTETQTETKSRDMHIRPYAITAVVVLVILTAAILAPDYMNYRYRKAALAAGQQRISAAPVGLGATNVATALPTQPGGAASLTAADVPLKTSDVFETYGRLLTLLLAFVSVLGVLVGYFVRKSLREVEEDMRQNVEQRMGLWKEEQDRVTASVKEQLADAKKELAEFKKLTEESKKVLAVLQAEADAAATKPSTGAVATAAAVEAIDKDPTIKP